MNNEGKRVERQESAGLPQKKEKMTLKRFWKEWREVILILAAVFVVFKFILQIAWVPSGSMETTLPTKSVLVGLQLPYIVADPVPQRGAIVTFWNDEEGEVLVKRVVGLPGETVSFEGGDVYIDGAQLGEDYLPEGVETLCDKTFQVPEGCVFVMGDNREWSKDSRLLQEPYIPAASIQGQMLLAFSIGSGQSWQGVRWIG